ncbi:hypothetical protein A4A49_21154 [Nicotiana attenuata]|uniref:Uncharacterized protein n=1 Tax=Nicotiana attenuata TaxID=49451 RepID=A0A314KM96_NICAT|nr:hypothetical protein A4A49_21154 [Nicotiana attenuata]
MNPNSYFLVEIANDLWALTEKKKGQKKSKLHKLLTFCGAGTGVASRSALSGLYSAISDDRQNPKRARRRLCYG